MVGMIGKCSILLLTCIWMYILQLWSKEVMAETVPMHVQQHHHHHHHHHRRVSKNTTRTGTMIQYGKTNISHGTNSDMISSVAPSDARSDVPSDTPSDAPSDARSDVPSTLPSDTPSDTPSTLPSDTPSTLPSDMPSDTPTTTMQFVFNEDAVQQGLDTLDLVGFAGIQSWSQTGTLMDSVRKIPYALDNLLPYTDIFASESYRFSNDGLRVTHIRSEETFDIPIYRSIYEDGTIVQIATTDRGNVSFAEIRVPDPKLYNDTFFLPSELITDAIVEDDSNDLDKEILISFTSKDLDSSKLANTFDLDDMELPNTNDSIGGDQRRHLSTNRPVIRSRSTATTIVTTDNNIASSVCDQYQIVKVAILYDSDLCSTYGSMSATRNRIITIVASASVLYEREMCVKLQLTDVYTPDTTCTRRSATSFTKPFQTDSACRGDRNLLEDFTNWMIPRRNQLGIDRSALIHLFTGADKVTSTIGCAWTGAVSVSIYIYIYIKPKGLNFRH
jgi:Metallo-peptidase family M12